MVSRRLDLSWERAGSRQPHYRPMLLRNDYLSLSLVSLFLAFDLSLLFFVVVFI